MSEPWNQTLSRFTGLLGNVSFRDGQGRDFTPDEGFLRWRDMTLEIKARRKTIYLIGNGASASMASHLAADLAKNAQIHTQVFSDLSLITAVANDLDYSQVFSEPLSRRAQPQDMLIAISSSGQSPNVLSACTTARELQMIVMTVTAMDRDNPLGKEGDLNAYVPAKTYGDAESCHAFILHHWMDMVESSVQEGKESP